MMPICFTFHLGRRATSPPGGRAYHLILLAKSRIVAGPARHGIAPRGVLCSADGDFFEFDSPAHSRRRRRPGAAAGTAQHDAGRLAESFAAPDATACPAAIRRNR